MLVWSVFFLVFLTRNASVTSKVQSTVYSTPYLPSSSGCYADTVIDVDVEGVTCGLEVALTK